MGQDMPLRKRGFEFSFDKYPAATQALIREKLHPVDQIINDLPRRFRFFSTFAMSQARGFLRKLSDRTDFEDVTYLCAMTLEPYGFFKNPAIKICCAYFSPLDRFLAEKAGKTVAHVPRQFVQFETTLKQKGYIDFLMHTVAPPDEQGFVNLGLNSEILPTCIGHFAKTGQTRVVLEINSHVPSVCGHEEYGGHRVHLSQVDAIYENHEPIQQLPDIVPTDIEKSIAANVLPFIEDGDTLQLGIGGVPNFIAQQLKDRRNLKFHSEMLTDALVDLYEAGAINSSGKEYMDGRIVGTFAAGSNRLYDFIDRNPEIVMLPIWQVNDPATIGRNRHMKSVNSTLMVDLHGQAYSDAIGFQQISGIGGQLEFVMGAQRSVGGRSILCLKSTSMVGGRRSSNIVLTPPLGTPVSVPRHLVDTIVTEYGTAAIKELDAVERAQALVSIAHPDFRDELARQARRVGLWERRPGFGTFKQRALFNNLGYLRQIKTAIEDRPQDKGRILLGEVVKQLRGPKRWQRLRRFVAQNRA
jgi:acyl-CoA hydrolase